MKKSKWGLLFSLIQPVLMGDLHWGSQGREVRPRQWCSDWKSSFKNTHFKNVFIFSKFRPQSLKLYLYFFHLADLFYCLLSEHFQAPFVDCKLWDSRHWIRRNTESSVLQCSADTQQIPVEQKALEGAELGRQPIWGQGVCLKGKKTVTIYCIEQRKLSLQGENALRPQRVRGTRSLAMGGGSHWNVRERSGRGGGGGRFLQAGTAWAGMNGTGGEGAMERGDQSRL